MARIGLIGAGNIGTELVKHIRGKSLVVGPVVTRSGIYDISKLQEWKGELSDYLRQHPEYKVAEPAEYRAPLRETDAVVLAIPTLDKGESAFKYMVELFEDVRPVVTCEKGALSLRFADFLEPLEDGRLGYRATVGGGTSMLPYMRERVRHGFDGRIYAVINGTLNFVFDGVASGRSVGEMTSEARKLGYAEPGAETALDIVNMESCEDVPMKSTILFNDFLHSLGERKFISSDFLRVVTRRISPEMLRDLVRQAGNRRYIVSIRRPNGDKENVIGGYSLEFAGWRLEGGFREISDDPLYQRLLPRGVDNALLVAEGADESKGVFNLKGPGAGPPPTAGSIIRDLEDMVKAGIIKS